MDIAAALRARILSISGVTALVNSRVFTGARWPQDVTLPAVKVMRVSKIEPAHLKGGSGLLAARVQVDSLAIRRDTVESVDAAIDGDGAGSGLSFWSGTVGSPALQVLLVEPIDDSEFFDPDERNEYRVMREYRVSFAR